MYKVYICTHSVDQKFVTCSCTINGYAIWNISVCL